MNLDLILLIVAAVCFIVAALKLVGLFFWVLTQIT